MDSQSDCGYTGGVSVEVLSSDSDSSEYKPDTSDLESEWSDGESLCELEGDALEENLASLKAEVDCHKPCHLSSCGASVCGDIGHAGG